MNTETITCSCGTKFSWEYEPSDEEWLLKFLRPRLCQDCKDRRAAEGRENARIKHEQSLTNAIAQMRFRVANETPLLFRQTDISHKRFNAAGWARVKEWKPSADKPWLGIIGETGTCKSRIACLLADAEMDRQFTLRNMDSYQEHWDIPRYRFASCNEISDFASLLQVGSFELKEKARCYLHDIRRADLLVIDDLGKGRMNTAIAAEMFALIDHRYVNALPTIWTANSTPEQFASNLAEDMAGPFAGRINDSSRILKF